MQMIFTTIIILFALGMIFNIISTIAGIGGGVFYVVILTVFFEMPINEAIDTSTFIILISSGIAFVEYLKQKRTSLKLALIFSSFSILGALICTILFLFITITNEILRILFAILLLVTGLRILQKSFKQKREGKNITNVYDPNFSVKDHEYKKELKKGIPLFIFAGFTANLLGIGGGVINTPALNLILGFPIHNSTAISTSIIFFTAIFNTIIKAINGQIDYLVGLVVASGAIIGSIMGARLSKRMPKYQLQIFVSLVLLGLSINMFLS